MAKTNTKTCTYYPNCNKGKSCPFSHPAKTGGSSPKPLLSGVCTHFAAGTCAYGLKCRRSHTLPDKSAGQEKTIGTSADHTVKGNQKGKGKKKPSISPEADRAEGNRDVNEVVDGDGSPCHNSSTPNCAKDVCHFYPSCDDADCEFRHVLTSTLENGSDHGDSTTRKSSAATSPKHSPQASIHDFDGDDDEQTEQHQPWGGNDGPQQEDYALPNGADYEDEAGPETRPEDVGQLPTEGISKLQSNIARPAVLSNGKHRQSQTLPAPVSASRVFSNHTDEPVIIPQYPHISEVKLHWSQFADPCADSQVPFCKGHAQGTCYIGNACNFRHSLTIQEYVALFHDQQPTLVTLRKEQNSNTAMSPASTEPDFYRASIPMAPPASIQLTLSTDGDSQHVQATRPSTFTQECKFYPIGKCRNGDRCPYGHTNHPPPELMNSSVSDGGLGDLDGYTTDRPKKPCRYFAEGRCSNGEHCKFLHENTSEPHSYTPSARASEDNSWTQQEEDNNRWESWEGGGSGRNERSATGADKERWNPEPDNSAWFTPNNESNGNGGHHNQSGPRESRKLPCHMYERRGYCRYGDSCKFAHDEPVISDYGGNSQVANVDEWPPTNEGSSTAVEEPPSGSESLSHDDAAPDSGVEIADENQNSKPAAESNAETNLESNTDDNNGWATEWTQDTGTSDLPPAKVKAYCKEFGQGVGCKRGDDCRFIHDDPNSIVSVSNDDVAQVVDSPVHEELESSSDVNEPEAVPSETEESDISELEPIAFDHPKVRKLILGATVTFGPDSTPESVETLADSCKLLVSNLPPETSMEDVRLLVHSFGGKPRENSLRTTEYSTTVIVEFPDATKARLALEALHRQTPGVRMIVASLKATAEPRFRVPSERPTLKVSWPKPSLTGWSHYPTIKMAKQEADRLHGVVLKGRAIHVEVCSHDKRQKENFAIKFSNLHPETNKGDIEQLCDGHTLVTLGDGPTYKGNPTEKVKGEIRNFGEYEYDKLPDIEQSSTSTAFITFATDDIASEVVDKLRSRPLEFLGDQPLDIKQVYFSHYRVKRRVFDLLKHEIDRLQEKDDGYTLQYNENYDAFCIRLSAFSKKQAAFVNANAELCHLLRGEIAQFEGGTVWNDYFETSSSEKALQQLKTDAIIPDKIGRCIRIFGSKGDQATAKEFQKLLLKVRAAHHEFDVPRGAIYPLVNGQFQTLLKTSQDKIGSRMNKFSFDVVRSKIIVRGTAEDLTKVKTFVDSLDLFPATYKRGVCEICYQKPDEPIRLSCRHSYCKSCLRMSVIFTGRAPLQCIAYPQLDNVNTQRCSSYVPYTVIHDLLSTLPAEEDRLLRSTLLTYVQNSDDFFTCPSIGCETILRTGPPGWSLLCSRCRTEICSFCKTLGHTGISCADMRE